MFVLNKLSNGWLNVDDNVSISVEEYVDLKRKKSMWIIQKLRISFLFNKYFYPLLMIVDLERNQCI